MKYSEFLENKQQINNDEGFDPIFMPDFLFDFQKLLTEWAIKGGKRATFADTGLGKTAMQLVFAENVVRKTNKKVLLLTPLAVSHQTIKEGEKFNIEVKRSRDGKPKGKITVTNYEQLEKFNPDDYVCCICDESSILKNMLGATRKLITRFTQKMPYRSLYTATPSPNDYVELGTSSEVLGQLPYMDMLQQFFRDTNNDKNPQWNKPKWELKGHAVNDFWRWVSSWAKVCRKPSDFGFDDSKFMLPGLKEKVHVLKITKPRQGEIFVVAANTLGEQREERKRTIEERSEEVLKLVSKHPISVIWCHYNYEADYLNKLLPNSVNISGSDSAENKEEKFISFSKGEIENLIIKPKIGAFGLNWQHVNHMVFFPSHSYEQYYQGIRRMYRFGQKKIVHVDIVTTEGELRVYHNMLRKAKESENMFNKLIQYMNDSITIKEQKHINIKIKIPTWV